MYLGDIVYYRGGVLQLHQLVRSLKAKLFSIKTKKKPQPFQLFSRGVIQSDNQVSQHTLLDPVFPL